MNEPVPAAPPPPAMTMRYRPQQAARWAIGTALVLVFACNTAAAQTPISPGDGDVPPPPADAGLTMVEPVVSDAEFDAAVPPLPSIDDALAAPLESLDDFDARLAAEDAAVADDNDLADTHRSVLSPAPPAALPNDTAVADPDFAAPLPPLAGFDVEPAVDTAGGDTDTSEPIRYERVIEGLASADNASNTGLAPLFETLATVTGNSGAVDNLVMLRARADEDALLLARIVASQGWYDAAVTAVIEERANRPYLLTMRVVPGPRYRIGSIVLNTPPTAPLELIRDALGLQIGEPLVADRVQEAEANIALRLPEAGYAFAAVGQRDIELDVATQLAAYQLPVTVGPLSHFGDIITSGELAFDAEHIGVIARFDRGDLYDSRMADDLQKALVATGLFAAVAVEPVATGVLTGAGDGSEFATINVTQTAGPPRTIAASAGYGTGQGLRVEGSWTHRNLFPPEGALIASAVAGTQEQGAGVTFRRANAGQRDRTFELSATVLRSTLDAFDSITGRLAARISRESTPIWQKRFPYAIGVELIGTREEAFDFRRSIRASRNFGIGALPIQVGFDGSDDLLNPTRGVRLDARVSPEAAVSDRIRPYVRVLTEATGYFPFGDQLVLAGRVRAGGISGIGRADLAPSRRYYAGGGGSVRGFGYQQLGPKGIDNRPAGGRSVNEAAAELRYRFGNFGVVGFVDAGQVYDSSLPKFSDIRFGAGLGGRFYTNFGPFRLDVATPIGRREGESIVSVYVSIGQAF